MNRFMYNTLCERVDRYGALIGVTLPNVIVFLVRLPAFRKLIVHA